MDKCEQIPGTVVFLPIKLLTLCCYLTGLSVLLFSTGCSTTEMKGTPFYTGEHLKRQGPAEQRVNAWPLFYYREPALSVVWPVFELTEDHAAVRPLFSVYGLDETNQEYNILWPLAQFDQRTGQNRIFPFFWGDDYRIAMPLYWHFGEPWGAKGGSDTLFPLWHLSRKEGERFNLYSPWPLVRFWSDQKDDVSGSMVLPLYYHRTSDLSSQFYSLPWSCGSDAEGYWRCVLPLFYQSSNTHRSTFITPLYAQGRVDATDWNTLVPLWYRSHDGANSFKFYSPLAYFWSDQRSEEHGSVVFPLYWHQNRKGSSQFNSLLWMNHTEPNGDYWRLLPPLFYQESNRAGSMLVTPLWAQGKTETNDWGAVIPFCYWDRQQHTLLSPLWAHWRNADTETWLAPWTLSWRTRNPERSDLTLLGGVARASWGEKPEADYLFPLFYNDSQSGTLLSPVWLRWRDGETETTVAPWLLSWKTHTPERSDLWLAGGFARASWGERPGGDYVIPLFYHDSERLLTPLFGWEDEADFSYYVTPLAGARTGERSGSWVFPLYSHSRVKSTGDVNDNYLLLGSYTKTKERSRSWFIPLYYYQNRFLPESFSENPKRYRTYGKNFWCLPLCWYRDQIHLRPERGSVAAAPDSELTTDFAPETAPEPVPARTNAPLVRDEVRAHGVFPLWSCESQATPAEGRSSEDTSVLLWLYDYKHDLGPLPGSRNSVTNDYTRSRVLWRLWHYEKLNGEVSVDVFPAFTYDRKPDGFKKVSFLWRFFRYERDAAGETRLDALFVPLKR